MQTVKRGWTETINPSRVRRNMLSFWTHLAGAPEMHAGNTHISAGLPLKDVTTKKTRGFKQQCALTHQSCSVLQPIRMIDPAFLHVHHGIIAQITAKSVHCALFPPQKGREKKRKMTASHSSAIRPQLL